MASEEVVDIEVARKKMKEWREEGYRNSDEVVDLGECLLLEHGNKLGDELWIVYEQVFIAALDCGRMDLATSCLQAIKQQFPRSLRVQKLKGIKMEAMERWVEAERIYEAILENDPANLVVRKRLIAMKKSQNKIIETIKDLCAYLKDFMSDQEAWMELAELYISQQEYHKAGFCMEELILSNPQNHLYHQRFAEIQYTIGTSEALDLARKYFSQALKLDPNNIRALYGMFLTSSNPFMSAKSNTKVKRSNIKYTNWSAQQIMEKYESEDIRISSVQKAALEHMFDNVHLSLPSNIPDN